MTTFPSQQATMFDAIRRAERARNTLRSGNPNAIDPEELRRRREVIEENMRRQELELRAARMAQFQAQQAPRGQRDPAAIRDTGMGVIDAEQRFGALRREASDIDRELQPVQTPEQIQAARQRLNDQIPGAIDSGIRQLQAEQTVRQNRVDARDARLGAIESRAAYGTAPDQSLAIDTFRALPAERRNQLLRGVPEQDARLGTIPDEIAALRAREGQAIDFGPVPQRDPAVEAARRARLIEQQGERGVAEARRRHMERIVTADADATLNDAAQLAERRRRVETATAERELAEALAGRDAAAAAGARARADQAIGEATLTGATAQARRAAEAAAAGATPITEAEQTALVALADQARVAARELAGRVGAEARGIDAGPGGVQVDDFSTDEATARVALLAELADRLDADAASPDPDRSGIARQIAAEVARALPEPFDGSDRRLRGDVGEFRVVDSRFIRTDRPLRVAQENAVRLARVRARLRDLAQVTAPR